MLFETTVFDRIHFKEVGISTQIKKQSVTLGHVYNIHDFMKPLRM